MMNYAALTQHNPIGSSAERCDVLVRTYDLVMLSQTEGKKIGEMNTMETTETTLTTPYECPVCLGSAKKGATLECGHKLCHRCARSWLVEVQPTCPLCRANTAYFSRSTRSQTRMQDVTTEMSLLCILAVAMTNNLEEYVTYLSVIVEDYILPNRHVWYRPDLNPFLKRIQRQARAIVGKEGAFADLIVDPQSQRVLRSFGNL